MPSPDLSPDEQARTEAQQAYAAALYHLEHHNPEAARRQLNTLSFEALDGLTRLSAHALVLQLALAEASFEEAMEHAAAALEITAEEPLIYHLMGQAFWASGDTRTGAEAVVIAAELLQTWETAKRTPRLPVDAPSVYYMAGEACQHYEQYEPALAFFQQAHHHAPANKTIAQSIKQVQAELDATNRAA